MEYKHLTLWSFLLLSFDFFVPIHAHPWLFMNKWFVLIYLNIIKHLQYQITCKRLYHSYRCATFKIKSKFLALVRVKINTRETHIPRMSTQMKVSMGARQIPISSLESWHTGIAMAHMPITEWPSSLVAWTTQSPPCVACSEFLRRNRWIKQIDQFKRPPQMKFSMQYYMANLDVWSHCILWVVHILA